MKYHYHCILSLSCGLIFLFLSAAIFSSCRSASEKKDSEDSEENIIQSVPMNEQLVEDFNKSKLIFYSLPSPIETAMLIKKAGATFDANILNSLDNIPKYNTNYKMALNLGIYSADLSYASLFDQSQTTIEYMGAARKLAEELGVMEAVDESTIKKLEENMNNREVVMDIISETYMNANAYLSENNRAAISVIVLAGGWIEGLYLASSLTKGSLSNNKELVDRILYQKLSLVTLLNMMKTYNENSDVARLMNKFEELESIFDKVTIINTSAVETETDTASRTTTIRAKSEIEIAPDDYVLLCKKIEELRSDFVS
ncbi:hypothetical protein [Anaerophaga thermohalophila]|uniref:hypothetical protein n=1 Tax=Anaerophaga thermohalophila TaxID=177400 RepID=UPI00037DE0E0|nr:hypothetical protein [Anaerophaga thermohalophila]